MLTEAQYYESLIERYLEVIADLRKALLTIAHSEIQDDPYSAGDHWNPGLYAKKVLSQVDNKLNK